MTTDEELRTVADAVESSLSVVGCGPGATGALADHLDDGQGETDCHDSSGDGRRATIVAVDLEDAADATATLETKACSDTLSDAETTIRRQDGFTIVVASVPSEFGVGERSALDRLRDVGSAVVLVRDGRIGDAVRELRALIEEAGVVNLDLADVRTLLSPGGLGAFTTGTGSASAPEAAVSTAIGGLASVVDAATAAGALVDAVGTPDLSVDGAASLVDGVRSHVGTDAHVIWGTAVADGDDLRAQGDLQARANPRLRDALQRGDTPRVREDARTRDGVRVRLLVAGIEPPEPTLAPGDPCPRCGGALSGYSLGDRSTIACDDCGYAGVSRT